MELLMQAKVQAKDRLIFALDVPTADQAITLVNQLVDHVGCFKIGLELFVASGPDFVRRIVDLAPVFLDLKLHDIPTTVERAASVAQTLGVRFLTVHADEGGRALQAAVKVAPRIGILCVTVLTSIAEEDLREVGFSYGLEELVRKRAEMAKRVGCHGLICSGKEAAKLRSVVGPGIKIITPGIRPLDGETADQKRVVTPKAAIQAGADMIVVGRPIRDASDPRAAADRIVEEIASARS